MDAGEVWLASSSEAEGEMSGAEKCSHVMAIDAAEAWLEDKAEDETGPDTDATTGSDYNQQPTVADAAKIWLTSDDDAKPSDPSSIPLVQAQFQDITLPQRDWVSHDFNYVDNTWLPDEDVEEDIDMDI